MAIPFTVIGGFLGAGKTTLLNRILMQSNGTRYAVLVNDFGAINIDQSLIQQHDGQTLALSNGCICCSLANGFVKTMLDLMQDSTQFDHIIVESSGVSNPQRIMDFARIDKELQADAIIVLVDALHFQNQFTDPLLTETLDWQIRSADILLLSKVDLVNSTDSLQTTLHQINPDTPILTTESALPLILNNQITSNLNQQIEPKNPISTKPEIAESFFQSQSFTTEKTLDKQTFINFSNNLPATILRSKGLLKFEDGYHLWHLCGKQRQLTPVSKKPKKTKESQELNIEQSQIVIIATQDCKNFQQISTDIKQLFADLIEN